MKPFGPSDHDDSVEFGERARLGRSRRRPRRRLLRAVPRVISSLRLAKSSARGRAERQPWRLRSSFLSLALIRLKAACISLICALLVTSALNAQTFTILHSFTAGSDGAFPYGGLILSGNTLYGTTYLGVSPTYAGNVFAVNTDGTSVINLHSFTALNSHDANSDGAYPHAALILSGNTLYGTTTIGGSSGRWHGVQSFVATSAATDSNSFRSQRHFDVADQCRRLHFVIRACHHRQLHQHSRRDDSLHQCHHRPATILPAQGELARNIREIQHH